MKKIMIIAALTLGTFASAQTVTANAVDHFGVDFGVTTPVNPGPYYITPRLTLSLTAEKYLGRTIVGNLNLAAKVSANSLFEVPDYGAQVQLVGTLQPEVAWYTNVGTNYLPGTPFSFNAGFGLVFGTKTQFYGENR